MEMDIDNYSQQAGAWFTEVVIQAMGFYAKKPILLCNLRKVCGISNELFI